MYGLYKTYMEKEYDPTLVQQEIEAEWDAKFGENSKSSGRISEKSSNKNASKVKRKDYVEKALPKRLKKDKYEIRRIFGAGTWRGWLPNPREWMDSIGNLLAGGTGFSGNIFTERNLEVLKTMLRKDHESVIKNTLEALMT
jgi:hypothetical protein